MVWTSGPHRWDRVLDMLQRLEALIAALRCEDLDDEQAYKRVTMRAERLHASIVEATNGAQADVIAAELAGDPTRYRRDSLRTLAEERRTIATLPTKD